MTRPESGKIEVVYRKVDDLVPRPTNPRTHSEEQINQVVESIKRFGFTNPILIDEDDGIIAGHCRQLAAQRMEMDQVPTILLAGLSDDEVRALVIADNRLALSAGWDDDLLTNELRSLADNGFDIGITGFSDDELSRLLAPAGDEGHTDPDDAPEVGKVATAREGDVWLLGPHRLVCGDATVPEFVDKCLNGVRPHIMVTDPPYGVEYDPSWRKKSGLAGEGNLAEGKVKNDDRADWTEAWALFPGSVAYVWHAGTKAHIVAASLERVGLGIRSQIVWVKNRFAISRGHYHVQHEPAFKAERDEDAVTMETAQYTVRSGDAAGWEGDRKQSTVWFIDHRKNDTGHGTQKPVECMERPLRNNSSPGQAVYEPFCGSGTTIIACQRTGRVCHAIELDPLYVDVIIRRWEAYTQRDAVLEHTGQTYGTVVADRAGDEDASVTDDDLVDAGLAPENQGDDADG